jgi:hypothetical protein
MPTKLNAGRRKSDPMLPTVLEKIKEMTDLYRTNLPVWETKSCWVSRSEIDQLLNYNGGNGMRIYYGRHAATETPEYANKHNVILVATLDSTNPLTPTSENSDDQLNPKVNSVIVSYQGMGDDAIPLCPPHCPTTPSVLSPKVLK